MAHEACKILDTGDIFPELAINLAGGGTFNCPADFGGRWNVLIFYRGYW